MGGHDELTPDELPVVGGVAGQEYVFVCGGYNGHGLGFALRAGGLPGRLMGGRANSHLAGAARFAGTAAAPSRD